MRAAATEAVERGAAVMAEAAEAMDGVKRGVAVRVAATVAAVVAGRRAVRAAVRAAAVR